MNMFNTIKGRFIMGIGTCLTKILSSIMERINDFSASIEEKTRDITQFKNTAETLSADFDSLKQIVN